jgi:two-component system, OmpR family, sensor histidine kinase MprB
MTFRSRVIAATVIAAALAVVLASLTSFLSTRNALTHSVDESLTQAASHRDDNFGGTPSILVLSNGSTLPSGVTSGFVDATITRYAKGLATGQLFRTVEVNNETLRELIVALPVGTPVAVNNSEFQTTTTSADVYFVAFSGQIAELRSLVRTLLFVSAGVLLLALSLGVLLARAALHPLEDVTDDIEEIAETSDMSRRLEEGDVDELGRLRRTFNRLLGTVEDSQTLQRQLVLDASHELRTPLTSLRTNAQVLSRAQQLAPEDLEQLTHDMVAQVDELAALVGDLAELARGERSEGAVVQLRLDDVVEECVETARTYARIKNVVIESDLETSTVVGRRDRLVRAVSNLLTNAIKFTPAGSEIRVTTAAGVVTVADSGPGVAAEDVALIFNRFWRSPLSRGLPGSGLGLSIVDQVVSELGGHVEVDRDPLLGGARFSIILPTV